MSPVDLYKLIERERRTLFENKYQETIRMAQEINKQHHESMKLIEDITNN